MMHDDLMTSEEVATALRVSRSHVFRMVEEGTLPVIKLGARVNRFRRSDIDALLATKPAEAAS